MLQIDIVELDIDQLGDTDACIDKDEYHSMISHTFEGRGIDGSKQSNGLVGAQHFNGAVGHFRKWKAS